MDALAVGGGTDIHSGLRAAYDILFGRQTHNKISSVFLLTDGQDPSRIDEKKAS